VEQLLPYYERELGLFRQYTREFASAYDLMLATLAISRRHFSPIINAPPGLRLYAGASALLSIQFTSSSAQYHLGQPGFSSLRLFANGVPSVRAALPDALLLHGAGAYVALNKHTIDGTLRPHETLVFAIATVGQRFLATYETGP
jgi:type VI protein secretion system component VasA